jgi:hypothetical protein
VITFLPSLSGRLSVDHYPNFPCLPVFPTSYQVINTFASISFRATLSDGYQTGPADFGYLSGICFVHVIADVFIASSCPINRTGMIAPNLSVSLCQSFAALPLRFLFR